MKNYILLFLTLFFGSTYGQQIYTVNHQEQSHSSFENRRTVTDWLHYDNGQNYTSFGSGSSSINLGVFIKLTSTILGGHINRQIEEVKFYLGSAATNITGNVDIQIFTSQGSTPDYEESIPMSSLTAGGWNTVTLATPYSITGSELYVGYHFVASGYIAGADDGSNFTPHVNLYTYNGNWSELDGLSQKNWNIQVGVGGALANSDAGISNIDIQDVVLPGNKDIIATINNYGTTTLNNIDFNYTVDNGTVHTDHLTGLNLATGQSTTVTHSVQWNATAGAHDIDVYTSNFNGGGDDDITANDHLVKSVSVASNTTQNLPLYEEFTSSTCSPCASFNSGSFNQSFLTNNAGHFTLIKYQMNWPGNGDPYYTDEGGVRRQYYGVSGVPTLYLDGKEDTNTSQNGLQQNLDNAYAKQAFFELSANHQIDPNTHDITVNVNVSPYLSGNYTLHCAVVEKTTTGNTGTNGETEFFNVLMKMVPDANGTDVALTVDTPANFTISGSLSTITVNQQSANINVEEWNDLEVIVFLQDDSTKEVLQSTISVEGTGSVETNTVFDNLKVYPNPSNGIVHIENATGIEVSIFDISGNLVYKNNQLNTNNQIDLSFLSQGIYVMKFIRNDNVEIRKIEMIK